MSLLFVDILYNTLSLCTIHVKRNKRLNFPETADEKLAIFNHRFLFLYDILNIMLKTIILSLGLMLTLLLSNEHNETKHLPYDQSLSLLQTIHDDAMIFGSGTKHIYVFLDPLCPHSRKFITMVSQKPKMLSKYQYHIFLLSIPRLKSEGVVSAVYTSKQTMETLLEIMIEEKVKRDQGDKMIQAKVDRIGNVAKKIHVNKRPYIFIVN